MRGYSNYSIMPLSSQITCNKALSVSSPTPDSIMHCILHILGTAQDSHTMPLQVTRQTRGRCVGRSSRELPPNLECQFLDSK